MPVLILVLAFAVTGIYPFGTQQIAVIDMYHQYVPFLGELQNKLHEGGSLFYSWNSGGGCNFWCLISYYCASPLNLLLVLFPEKLLMEGVTVIFMIKIGLTGSFMYIYLSRVQSPTSCLMTNRENRETVAFACMYALCSFVIGYYWCVMWLEAVMLLPLCMLGMNRLVTDGKIALYTVTLALIVFCNYYMAIMVCIFIVVYYPVVYFINVSGKGAKACLATTVKAVLCSFLAIGMSAVMMLPTYLGMKSAYYFSSEMPDEWEFYEDALDILNQLLPNAHLTYIEGLPNICCGLLATLMFIMYFICSRISIKEKNLNAAFLVFMFFSLNVNKLDFIWHGMHFPNQLPYRFSFVICFVIVGMAYKAFRNLDAINVKHVSAASLGIAAYYVLAQKLFAGTVDDMNLFFYYGLALLTAYTTVIVMYRRGMLSGRYFSVLVVAVVAAEMCISTCTGFDTVGNSSRETYNENKTEITKLSDYVNEVSGPVSEGGSGEFARVEVDNPIIHNCPALYHYHGMGQFSSALNAGTTELMEKIGLEGHPGSNRFNYNETDPVTSCITNVNYMIAKNRKLEDPDFEYVKQEGYSRLYRSRYPLSIGYGMPNSIRTWSPEDENPFVNLDDYVKAATGGEIEKVFIRKGTGEIKDSGTYSYYETEETVESRLTDGSTEGSVSIEYTADADGKYYVYVAADYAETITIERKNTYDSLDVQPDCGSILNIGNLEKDETFKVNVEFEQGKAGRITCRVCTLDYDAWNKAYGVIADNTMTVTEASDTKITGTIDMKEDGVLVTSIPYDEGWTMKVDGKDREINELTGGAWISTGLLKGKHEVELKFRPPGIIQGAVISLLSILILIGATVWPVVRLRRRYSQEESDYNIE